MKLKIALIVSTLFILTSQKTVYGQELTGSELSSDTICLDIEVVKMLAASHEKYIFADSLIKINEEEIYLLTELLEEKHDQLQIGELLINTQRNEIKRLQRQRTILGVGVGVSLIAVLLLAL